MPAAKLTDLIGEIKYEKAHHDLWQAVDDKYWVPPAPGGVPGHVPLVLSWDSQKKRTAGLGEAGCSQSKGSTCNKAQ